ncbi:MAG: TonB-dependent receptor plug domain-containing protein, partial [Candidatus Latescibacteria bacterium]|nr:TonB-dependent receptor plug domain-containing protein [Candidatus Latescibacterota bacterium]
MGSRRDWILALALSVVFGSIGQGHAQEEDLDQLLDMGLEALMDLEVVTASKKPQTVAEAPANIAVITREMIERRGYRTLEEALRDLPGFDFTTSQPSGEYPTHFIFRGITDVGQTKTLMMVDGIVRNDASNGWFQNVGYAFTLNDVERIEVISGPGSALYGANAYAGLVHVITRPLNDGQPGLEAQAKATFGRHRTLVCPVPEVLLRYGSESGFRMQLAGRWYRTNGDGGIGRPDPGRYFHGNFEPDVVLTTEHGNIPNERKGDGTRKRLADGFGTDVDDVCLRGRFQKGSFTLGFTYWDRTEGLGSEVVGYEYFTNTPGIDYRARHEGYTVFGSHSFGLSETATSRSKLYVRNTRILPETGFVYTYKYQSVANGADPPVTDKVKGYHGEGYVAGLEQQLDLALSPETSL